MADPRLVFDPVAAFLRRPFHEVLSVHHPSHPTPPPTTPPSIHTLLQRAASFQWTAVLDLATTLLANHHDKHPLLPHQNLICITLRATALLQTRQIAAAAHALAELGDLDAPQYHFHSFPHLYPDHPYPSPTFVPFQLRILAIDIRIRNADPTALPHCYHLLARVLADTTLSDTHRAARHAALLSCLASYHLVAHQHDAAVDIARQLMLVLGGDANALYIYVRVLLRVGDFDAAAAMLKLAPRRNGFTHTMQHLHMGMLQAARARYHEALLEYEAVIQSCDDEHHVVQAARLRAQAMNNAAVCLMQCGRLAEAVDRLENALRGDPQVALDEGLTFNLAVMYELAYPNQSAEKKQVLRDLASRFGRQGFDLMQIPADGDVRH